MILFASYDVYIIDGGEDAFDAPTGIFSDAQYAKMLIDRDNPGLTWEMVEDPDNLRIMWYGYIDNVLAAKVVPFAVNSFFVKEGEILGIF